MNSYYKTINEHGQVVLNLPTSKIGYCYPELWFCIPKNDKLNYVWIDLTLRAVYELDEKVFMNSYINGPELTNEVLKEIGLKATLKSLAEVTKEIKEML